MVYSVFVGKYENVNVSKSDLKKLNKVGLKGYLFYKGDFYSLKVGAFMDQTKAYNLKANLEKCGFIAYIEVSNIV